MCGFTVSYKDNKQNNHFVSKRGQDATNTIQYNDFTFTHYLLHLTGEKTLQPFVKNNIVCIFNGEIYNYLDFDVSYKTDGECIIDCYQKYGYLFARHLDGEFAIALYDFNKQIVIFITDSFATKPLWINEQLECSSYQSGIENGIKLNANSLILKSFDKKYNINSEVFKFDFDNQYKESYSDCINAFKNSIKKRAKEDCFIGLSSGYDSGAISCELNNQNINYKAYSILASENKEVLKKRLQLCKNSELILQFDENEENKHLSLNAESFNYCIQYDSHVCTDSYKKDYAAKALSHICRLANKEKRKIYLSGTGADEILSDYSLIPNQSLFKGKFPNRLIKWPNFHVSCMKSYLGKEECVAGSWNIETRYPFLDKQFVQEFLFLSVDLKNKFYKNVLHEYLTLNNYPFEVNKKIGFSI